MEAHPLETVPETEDADVKKLLKLQMMFMKADETRRGQHGKSHGCLKIEFRVRDDVPAPLRHGVFAEAGVYLGLIRFSNGGGKDDRGEDAHGMAIKLLDVPGAKASGHEDDTQDFVLVDCPVFFCKTPGDVAAFMQAQIKARGGPPVAWFEEHPVETKIFQELFMKKPGPHPLVMEYYSQTPYLLGTSAVKYVARPAPENRERTPETTLGDSPDFLRERMVAYLKEHEARFEFGVQVQNDAGTEPVEDPTVEWKTPFVPLAELRIKAQTFDSDAVKAFDENLSFSPWQALQVHRPLGGVNRARRIVYESSSIKRHEVNAAPRQEPSVGDLPW